MATGYTHPLKDGEIKTFREFAMECARAFAIDIRDHPPETPIPQGREPSEYHKKALDDARADLDEKIHWTDEQWAQLQGKEIFDAEARYDEAMREEQITLRRYHAMLEKVKAWVPPSEKHEGLKDFMIQQIESSIEHDGGFAHFVKPPEPMPVEEFREERLAQLRKSITRHEEEWGEELKRCQGWTDYYQGFWHSMENLPDELKEPIE